MQGPCSASAPSLSAQPSLLPEAFAHPLIHSFPHQSGEAETLREKGEETERSREASGSRCSVKRGQGWWLEAIEKMQTEWPPEPPGTGRSLESTGGT